MREAFPGDIIILTSDGFDESTLDASMFEQNTPIKKLPRQMLAANNDVNDDITIITTKIQPPINYTRNNRRTDNWKSRVAN